MKVETVKTDSLIPHGFNNVKHSDQQVDRIASSIEQFGFNVPVVINKDNIIIAGHGRWMAAKKLGLEEVPAVRADHLTPAQERAYRILDNKLTRDSEWDVDSLRVEFDLLAEDGFEFKEWGLDTAFPALTEHILNDDQKLEEAPPPEHVPQFLVVIECDDEGAQQVLYDEFQERGLKCKIIT